MVEKITLSFLVSSLLELSCQRTGKYNLLNFIYYWFLIIFITSIFRLPLYEDFDFDFDNILSDSGAVVDNDCDHFTPNDIQVKMVGDSKYSNFNNKEVRIILKFDYLEK